MLSVFSTGRSLMLSTLVAGLLTTGLVFQQIQGPLTAESAPTTKSTPKKAVGKSAAAAKTAKNPKANVKYLPADAISLVKYPQTFMNKDVVLEGVFNSFSNLALDYPGALRESKSHVTILIRRPDVDHHEIPLAELKMFYPREKGESVLTLEPGDKIRIKGHIFSNALNEPWLDIDAVEVIEKVKKKDEKQSTQCC